MLNEPVIPLFPIPESTAISHTACHRTIRREQVKQQSACDHLSMLIEALVIAFVCATMSFEASRKTDEQTEALREARSKLLSNKGFLMVLILSVCRFKYHFLTFPRARDFISALSKSPPEGQGVKNALFPGHFLSFCESIKGSLEFAMALVPLKLVAL